MTKPLPPNSVVMVLLTGAIAGLLSGCRSSALAPTFSIAPATVLPRSTTSPDATVLLFHVTGDNANRDPIVLTEVRYQLSMGGRPVFQGVRSAGATLRAFGQNTVMLPVPIAPGAVPMVGSQPYTMRATIEYIPAGTFSQTLYDAGFVRPTGQIEATGTADLGAP